MTYQFSSSFDDNKLEITKNGDINIHVDIINTEQKMFTFELNNDCLTDLIGALQDIERSVFIDEINELRAKNKLTTQ